MAKSTTRTGTSKTTLAERLSAPRPVTADQPIAEQISTLEALIRARPETSRVLEIGPALAEHILTSKNLSNRPMKPGKIKDYARDLSAGRWGLTGDTLKFGKDGTLKDGQNRLAAVVRANGPVLTSHAVFGVEPDLFTRMDIGKNRTPADVFSIAGLTYANHAASAVRWLLILTGPNPGNRGASFSNEELLHAYRTRFDPVSIEHSVKIALEVKKNTGSPIGATAALHYLFATVDPDAANQFMLDWASGHGSKNSPTVQLQKRIKEILAATNNRLHETVRNVLIIRAWEAYREGRPLRASELNFDPATDPFPAESIPQTEPKAATRPATLAARRGENGVPMHAG